MARSLLRIRKTQANTPSIRPGQKVKVYSGTRVSNQVIKYGEVIGIREKDHKLLLNERPDFKDLSVSQFQHYREINQVVFLNAINQDNHWQPMLADMSSEQWKEIKKCTGKNAKLIIKGREVNNG